MTSIFAIVLATTSVACKVGPNYVPPTPTVESSYKELSIKPATSQPSVLTPGRGAMIEWWSTLRDPELQILMRRAGDDNLNLKQATSRVREARALLRGAGARLAPSIDGSAGFVHIDGGKGVSLSSDSKPLVMDLFTTGLDSTWEMDVFGGQRRQIEAAAAQYDAIVDDRSAVMISLLAEVARDYLQLRGVQQRLAIAQSNLALQQDTLDLTHSLRKSGFKTELDVSRAQTQVSETQAAAVPLQTQTVQIEHAIAELLGEQPGALETELDQPAPPVGIPAMVTVGVPSDLLRRRPDLRRSERQLAAANAQIGAAISDYYPKFSLTGAFGFDSNQFKSMFDFDSRYFVIYPSVSWKLLDWGQTKAKVDAARERYQQAFLAYQENLLTALREVEDAMVAYTREQEHRDHLAAAVGTARDAVSLSRDQYKQGLIDFLQVIDAQRELLSVQDQLAQSDQAIAQNLVALYKALGGGWEYDTAKPMQAESNPFTGRASSAGRIDGK